MNASDISLSVWFCLAVQLFWVVWGIKRFARRNDDLPLVLSIFLAYCGGYRYLGAVWGRFEWGSLRSFGLDAASSDFSSTALALKAIILGESVLLATYCYLQTRTVISTRERLPVLLQKRMRMLLLILAPISVGGALLAGYYTAISHALGLSIAFQVSNYVACFPLILVSMAILVVLAWRFGALGGVRQKLFACAFLGVVAFLTFGPTGRFQFLGWMIASAYLISTTRFGLQRIPVLAAGAALTLALFGIAGALRGYREGDANLLVAGFERTKSGEDANMLDGFTYLMGVYPKLLPYRLGGEHFEILLRTIPRQLWPGKPVGGYMNKLGLFDASSTVTVGISPTLFGSFYAEGGWIGIVVCSIVYGWVAAWVVRYSISLRMIFGTLIRACLIAACIPLLRGGDLPGIYAWLGMSFWPVMLLLWWNRRFLYVMENTTSQKRSSVPENRRNARHPVFSAPGLRGTGI